jgi:hypothetical protein
VREADNLTTFMCRMSWKSRSLNFLEDSGPHRACYVTALTLPFIVISYRVTVLKVQYCDLTQGVAIRGIAFILSYFEAI